MIAPLPTAAGRPLPLPTHVMVVARAAFMAALPEGGQRGARRNAWAGMSADSARGRSRREADAAMERAEQVAYARQLRRSAHT